MTWKFSRSHQATFWECPFKGYAAYYADGTGYEPARLDVAQSSGTLGHSMKGHAFLYIKEHDSFPPPKVIDESVQVAEKEYRESVAKRGLDLTGNQEFELSRQLALIEGLFRGWCKVKLPIIHQQYRIISVEEEWEIEIAPDIIMMIRIDDVRENRETGELWAEDLKTPGFMSSSYREQWRYSSQTIAHVWAVEQHFQRACEGVIMDFWYKGRKLRDEVTGEDNYYSPLVRGYLRRGVPPYSEDELKWEQDSSKPCASCDHWKSRHGKRGCSVAGCTCMEYVESLWEPVDVWQWGRVKEWVNLLPEDVLEKQFFEKVVNRSGREIEIWLDQTRREQIRIREGVQLINNGSPVLLQDFIMGYFPMRLSENCFQNKFRKTCTFLPFCYGKVDSLQYREYWIPRTPHHPGEFEEE